MASSMNGLAGLNGPSSSNTSGVHHCSSSLTTASGESVVGINTSSSNTCLKDTDILKSQLTTREGVYRSMAGNEFRPNRVMGTYNIGGPGLGSSGMGVSSSNSNSGQTPVKVSFICMKDNLGLPVDRICFNVGRELFVYNYGGVSKATADHSKPIDKRIYKGTFPTCHDFNEKSVSLDSVHLLIGFSAGQIQLIDPIKKEFNKLYNEERLIDKTRVTCIKWVPNSSSVFLVSHASGQLYVYKDDLPCGTTPPHYQLFKSGDAFSVYTCRAKSTRNPLYRWVVGEGSINEFSFSPCGKFLAIVSQDGFLRVFEYDTMELVGRMRSYFGGLLCLSWSPDGRFIVTGGEDDLISVWSMSQKRVVARGQGHRSWISVVAFDAYTTSTSDVSTGDARLDSRRLTRSTSSDDEPSSTASVPSNDRDHRVIGNNNPSNNRNSPSSQNHHDKIPATGLDPPVTSYRIGSVAQDTLLCLWDLNDDVLKQPVGRSRASILVHSPSTTVAESGRTASGSFSSSGYNTGSTATQTDHPVVSNASSNATLIANNKHWDSTVSSNNVVSNDTTSSTSNLLIPSSLQTTNKNETSESNTITNKKKEHKRSFSLGSRSSEKNQNKKDHNKDKYVDDPVKLLGNQCCPRLEDVPMLEPLVCKKISHERLTALVFREDCFVAACQEGYVSTWARPGHGPRTSPGVTDSDDHIIIDAEDTIV